MANTLPITSFTSLKINSPSSNASGTDGIFFLEGVTDTQLKSLGDAFPNGIPDGVIAYNSTAKVFGFKQDGVWTKLSNDPYNGITFVGNEENIEALQLPKFTNNQSGNKLGGMFVDRVADGETTRIPLTVASNYSAVPNQVLVGAFQGATIISRPVTIDVDGNTVIGGALTVSGTHSKTIGTGSSYTKIDSTGSNAENDIKDPLNVTDVSIYCKGALLTTTLYAYTGTITASSKNIKNILETTDIKSESLALFKQIPFKKYEYKDKIKYRNGVTYGMIAEELQEVVPHSVFYNTDAAPNIMQPIDLIETHDIGNNTYSYKFSFKNSNFALDEEIKIGDKLLMLDDKGANECVIKAIESDFISIESNSSLDGSLYAYGTYMAIPYICKDNIFELGMVALQKLINTVESQSEEIKTLKTQINNMQNSLGL